MEDFQKELNQVLNKYQDFERIQKHLKNLEIQLTSGYRELDKFEKILDKHGQDVQQLESLSLKAIFHKILGSKKEQLDKERQEYLEAALKRNEHKKSLELLEYEKKVLTDKLKKLQDIPAQAEMMIQKRENDLMRSGTPVGMRILTIAQQIDASRHLKREIKEALDAGRDVVVILEEMESYLRNDGWPRNDDLCETFEHRQSSCSIT
jgi:DNA repair exonuclease SbcCD ATPase subunit